jgi:hypothetical protein
LVPPNFKECCTACLFAHCVYMTESVTEWFLFVDNLNRLLIFRIYF